MDDYFDETLEKEDLWPASEPVDMKPLYTRFYNAIHEIAINLVCGSCGVVGHNTKEFQQLPPIDPNLRLLTVDPSLIPFDYSCGISLLDDQRIMIDPLSIVRWETGVRIYVCTSCNRYLQRDQFPTEALANFHWIGPVPEELKALTLMEEMLIAHMHMFGKIIRLGNRKSCSALKGHVVLVPEETLALLDILPLPPDHLTDLAHVVWVGTTAPDRSKLVRYFSVRKTKVLNALR